MPYLEATTHVDTNLIWDTDGYYAFGHDGWKDITLTAKMIYNGGEIGIIPRFDSYITYVAFTIGNYTNDAQSGLPGTTIGKASLFAQISANSIHLGEVNLASELVVGQEYELKAEIKRTNYRIYLDGVRLFNVEYNGLNNGSGALYGVAGTEATEYQVEDGFAEGWETNVGATTGAIVDVQELPNKDRYLQLDATNAAGVVFAKQIVDLYSFSQTEEDGRKPFTLSFNQKDTIFAVVQEQNGSNLEEYEFDPITTDDWSHTEKQVRINGDCTQVKIVFVTTQGNKGAVNNVQFEPGSYGTGYIHNDSVSFTDRGPSWITYPSKDNISNKAGAISVWVKPSITYDDDKGLYPTFLEYHDGDQAILLFHGGEQVQFQYGEAMITVPKVLQKDTWYHMAATWSEYELTLYVDGTKASSTGVYSMTGSSDIIKVGYGDLLGFIFDGVIDDLIIYSKPISSEDVLKLLGATDPVPNNDGMLLRATFNHAIGSFNKSVIEMTPAPLYGSPVIVTKEDNQPMQKVSFFDLKTGDYLTHTTEYHVYDGVSDFIRLGYSKIDNQSFPIAVQDHLGSTVGVPYNIEGNKILITLDDEEKKRLRGLVLAISYQPENPYAVDFNIGQPDSFKVTLGKHDGKPVTVSYEGNKFSDEKLATMIELNPLLNPQHKGFMYIVPSANKVASFKTKVSPSDLSADGVSEAVVIIEPIDSHGNFVSYAQLTVSSKHGTVIPSYDTGAVKLREIAGRYIYRYRAPLLYFKDQKTVELSDVINVIDSKTGLGVQIPISLSLADSYPNTDRGMSVEQQNWEMILVYLMEKITRYIGGPASDVPGDLMELLDFNGDNKIGLEEIVYINDNKYTTDLYNKYVSIFNWYITNG